jgi:hypothetical protein
MNEIYFVIRIYINEKAIFFCIIFILYSNFYLELRNFIFKYTIV